MNKIDINENSNDANDPHSDLDAFFIKISRSITHRRWHRAELRMSLQRTHLIGYNRAERIINQLEEANYIEIVRSRFNYWGLGWLIVTILMLVIGYVTSVFVWQLTVLCIGAIIGELLRDSGVVQDIDFDTYDNLIYWVIFAPVLILLTFGWREAPYYKDAGKGWGHGLFMLSLVALQFAEGFTTMTVNSWFYLAVPLVCLLPFFTMRIVRNTVLKS